MLWQRSPVAYSRHWQPLVTVGCMAPCPHVSVCSRPIGSRNMTWRVVSWDWAAIMQAYTKRCQRVQVNANSSSITTKDQYQSMKFCNLAFNRQYSYQSVSHWLSMGRSCCVINCTNKSHDYKGVLLNNGLSFHRFPGVKTHQGSEVHLLTTRRRRAWVAAVRRVNITFEHIPSSMYVCSRHFHGGKFVQNLFDHPPIPTHLAFCLFHPAHSPRPQCSETWTWPLNEQHINDSSCTFNW